jgi:hypothetical protein
MDSEELRAVILYIRPTEHYLEFSSKCSWSFYDGFYVIKAVNMKIPIFYHVVPSSSLEVHRSVERPNCPQLQVKDMLRKQQSQLVFV